MRPALAVALVAAAALLGACGGSSSGSSGDTNTTLDCSSAAIEHAPDFNTYDAACQQQLQEQIKSHNGD